MISLQNYINGEFVSAVSGKTLDNVDPSTGKVYSLIPRSEQADVDAAVTAAEAAFPSWSNLSVEKRSEVLIRLADLIKSNAGTTTTWSRDGTTPG